MRFICRASGELIDSATSAEELKDANARIAARIVCAPAGAYEGLSWVETKNFAGLLSGGFVESAWMEFMFRPADAPGKNYVLRFFRLENGKRAEVVDFLKGMKFEAAHYDEVWRMQGWDGYMGVILAISENHCEQWFYSDAGYPNNMRMPKKSKIKRTEKGIALKAKSDEGYYSLNWKFVEKGGKRFLASEDDLQEARDHGRWLRQIDAKEFSRHLADQTPFGRPYSLHETETNKND